MLFFKLQSFVVSIILVAYSSVTPRCLVDSLYFCDQAHHSLTHCLLISDIASKSLVSSPPGGIGCMFVLCMSVCMCLCRVCVLCGPVVCVHLFM